MATIGRSSPNYCVRELFANMVSEGRNLVGVTSLRRTAVVLPLSFVRPGLQSLEKHLSSLILLAVAGAHT